MLKAGYVIDLHELVEAGQKPLTEPSTTAILKSIARHVAPDWPLLLAIIGTTVATAACNITTSVAIGELVTVVQNLLHDGNNLSHADLSGLNIPAFKLLGLFAGQGNGI